MRARLIQARTKKQFKQKKRGPWKKYVSSVNVNTPSKKVWDMIRKISRKNVASHMHHLKDENGTLITDRVEIANTLGAAIEKCSSSEKYSKDCQSIKAQKEKHKINFKTNKNLRYNKKFTMRDLKRSLKSPIIHLLAQIRSIMKFYATFLLRLSIYYWTSSMKHGKVTHFRNHGEKLWLFQFPNPERIILIFLIINLLLSKFAFVKLLKKWSMNVLYVFWKIMVYCLNSNVVIGQIDRKLII